MTIITFGGQEILNKSGNSPYRLLSHSHLGRYDVSLFEANTIQLNQRVRVVLDRKYHFHGILIVVQQLLNHVIGQSQTIKLGVGQRIIFLFIIILNNPSRRSGSHAFDLHQLLHVALTDNRKRILKDLVHLSDLILSQKCRQERFLVDLRGEIHILANIDQIVL